MSIDTSFTRVISINASLKTCYTGQQQDNAFMRKLEQFYLYKAFVAQNCTNVMSKVRIWVHSKVPILVMFH
jgi:hypothetical protein